MASPTMLRSAAAFNAIQSDSHSRAHPLLLLRYRRNDLDQTRYGISTGKRVGAAVVRNLIRRRLRTVLRRHDVHIKRGWDVLLVVRPGGSTVSQDHLEQAFLSVMQRADLLATVQ